MIICKHGGTLVPGGISGCCFLRGELHIGLKEDIWDLPWFFINTLRSKANGLFCKDTWNKEWLVVARRETCSLLNVETLEGDRVSLTLLGLTFFGVTGSAEPLSSDKRMPTFYL